jgi:hypothetical protein
MHLGIWLGCYGQRWLYGLNSELMWVLSQISLQKINNDIVYVHNTGRVRGSVLVVYNAECADEKKISKIGSSNRFQVTGL